MEIVRNIHAGPGRVATPEDVTDAVLRGSWVIDVRLRPTAAPHAGWLVDAEDHIVFLADSPEPVDAA